MTRKQYYNLSLKKYKDIKPTDTALALITVFDEAGWKYCLCQQETDDNELQIKQIFF